jgi:two-component system nitrate/nitrite sensor histidine kinase NarX
MRNRLFQWINRTWLAGLLALLAAGGVYGLARAGGEAPLWALALSAATLLAGLGWWAALRWRRAAHRAAAVERRAVEHDLSAAQHSEAEARRRLQLLLDLNRSIAQARDEKSLMDAALAAVNGLTGAIGCSFVPVDELEQPLPAFTSGRLPEPVLRAWAGHLAGSLLRERCESCGALHSEPGGCPLHPQEIGGALTVSCIPVYTGGEPRRKLGVMNLYLPAGARVEPDTGSFLAELLRELAPAIENARLRDQEMATLRQIQLLHTPEGSPADLLGSLLENLRQAMDAGTVLLRLRPSQDERLSGLNVLRGPQPALPAAELENVFQQVLHGRPARSAPAGSDRPVGGAGAWLALPMRLPEGATVGMLLVERAAGLPFHPRQEAILTTVAAQAALLVENERMLRSLEYRVIIQERTRLAREIHDGLAQTLAFLKLQAGQMQNYLAQGDLSRLSQVLNDNYQVLAEAYLDTRQAIDNLRLTPRDGLVASLEQVAADFEPVLGITIERSFQPVPPAWTQQLTPEVQAQLLRIVQEALNNVRKHARANRVWLHLHEWQEELRIEVGDDGLGFDAGDVPEVSHHGLRGMRERAEIIGADFQIVSQVRQGTVVRLALPAHKETLR